MFVLNPKKVESNRLIISIGHKVAAGHQPHITGTGVHKDKRTKRNRTRSDRKRTSINEWD